MQVRVSADRGKEDRLSSRSPSPPNRSCGSRTRLSGWWFYLNTGLTDQSTGGDVTGSNALHAHHRTVDRVACKQRQQLDPHPDTRERRHAKKTSDEDRASIPAAFPPPLSSPATLRQTSARRNFTVFQIDLVDRRTAMVGVGVDASPVAEQVPIVRLNDQAALAACPAIPGD